MQTLVLSWVCMYGEVAVLDSGWLNFGALFLPRAFAFVVPPDTLNSLCLSSLTSRSLHYPLVCAPNDNPNAPRSFRVQVPVSVGGSPDPAVQEGLRHGRASGLPRPVPVAAHRNPRGRGREIPGPSVRVHQDAPPSSTLVVVFYVDPHWRRNRPRRQRHFGPEPGGRSER